ncbi:hypothetical protein FPV67DRAFT_1673032 [Lyophyllum atratum]|nr:hypothetical protein FPV67DRAFT_1673032 [Lyophyllum atratum]
MHMDARPYQFREWELAQQCLENLGRGNTVVINNYPCVSNVDFNTYLEQSELTLRSPRRDILDMEVRHADVEHPHIQRTLQDFIESATDHSKVQCILSLELGQSVCPPVVAHLDHGYTRGLTNVRDLSEKTTVLDDHYRTRNWALAHHTAVHTLEHHDADGQGTQFTIRVGAKQWGILRPKGYTEAQTRAALEDLHDQFLRDGLTEDTWQLAWEKLGGEAYIGFRGPVAPTEKDRNLTGPQPETTGLPVAVAEDLRRPRLRLLGNGRCAELVKDRSRPVRTDKSHATPTAASIPSIPSNRHQHRLPPDKATRRRCGNSRKRVTQGNGGEARRADPSWGRASRTLRTPFSRPHSLHALESPVSTATSPNEPDAAPCGSGKVLTAATSSLPAHIAATSHLPTALPLLAHAATTSPPSDARVARPQVTRSSLPAHTPATSHPPTALPLLLLAHHAHATTTPTLMPPGAFHAVYTPIRSIALGGHFLTYNTLHLTEVSRAYDHRKARLVTNADHPSIHLTLSGMMVTLFREPSKIKLHTKCIQALCRMVIHYDDYIADTGKGHLTRAIHSLAKNNRICKLARILAQTIVEGMGWDLGRDSDFLFTGGSDGWMDPGDLIDAE